MRRPHQAVGALHGDGIFYHLAGKLPVDPVIQTVYSIIIYGDGMVCGDVAGHKRIQYAVQQGRAKLRQFKLSDRLIHLVFRREILLKKFDDLFSNLITHFTKDNHNLFLATSSFCWVGETMVQAPAGP